MQHNTVDILLLVLQKLLAKYLSGSISSLWHESQATICIKNTMNKPYQTRLNTKLGCKHNILGTFLPSSLLSSPSHEEYPSLPHAYVQCPHNSLWLSPIARIQRPDKNKTNLVLVRKSLKWQDITTTSLKPTTEEIESRISCRPKRPYQLRHYK